MKETELDIKKLAQKGRDSFFFFTRAILGYDKVTKSIHRPICKELERLEKEHKRMVVMLPRDWYKTTIATISYSIWRAVRNPEIRILLCQNTFTNACGKLAAIDQIFTKNELFRACYSEILPDSSCTWSKEKMCVKRNGAFPEGTFEAAGVNTAVVSRHYDLIIEDDTVAPNFDNMTGAMMQPTRSDVEKCIGWHRLAHPLLIEPADSQILVVGTRWIEDDLIEWVMKNEHDYFVIQRSVREDENGKPSKTGRIVWEKTDDGVTKFNEKVLSQLEAALGPYMFATLYLNCPTASENMLFKSSWIKYYEHVNIKDLIVFTSTDLASADKTSSSDPDYTVIMSVGVNPKTGLIYVLDIDRGRYNPGETIDIIFNHYLKYKSLKVIIEAIGYQRTLCHWIDERMQKTNVYFVVDEIKSYSASKVDRIRALQPFYAASRILMKTNMQALENELVNFPYGKHDDVIDTLSSQIGYWNSVIESEAKPEEVKVVVNHIDALYDSIKKTQLNAFNDTASTIGLKGFLRRPEIMTTINPKKNIFLNCGYN